MNGTIKKGGGETLERHGGTFHPGSGEVRRGLCFWVGAGGVGGWGGRSGGGGAANKGSLLGGMTVRGRQWL